MKERVKKTIVFLLDLLYPIYCVNCGKEGFWICQNCKDKVIFWNKQKCPYCQSLKSCGCGKDFMLKDFFIGCNYDENSTIKKALQTFKYKYAEELAKDLVSIFFKQTENFFDDIDIILPIPLHYKRQKERGFNQAELLAEELAKNYNKATDLSVMKRIKHTKQQAKLKKEQRTENVKDAFLCLKPDFVNAKNILLVDDVLTTGSTINECAKPLFSAGAKNVKAWVVAKG